MIIHWIFFILVIWTVPCTSLQCYKCICPSFNESACDCAQEIEAESGSHCTIIKDLHSSNGYYELGFSRLNSSYIRIKDPYYIIVDESIYYNETSGVWETKTSRVVHGCDWDYCNKFSLIATLPNSFQININNTWLTDNIYGNEASISCHVCPNSLCGNSTFPIDYSLCPFTLCENATTCSLNGIWHDVGTDEACYESRCSPPFIGDEFTDDEAKNSVRVEAIVYLAGNRSNFEIWELDINCGAYNCTRLNIFQEIKPQITGVVSNLTAFPTSRPTTTTGSSTTTRTTTPFARPLLCYNCSCSTTPCPCTTYELSSADNTHCSITRRHSGQNVHIEYGHVNVNASYFYIRDYPYVAVDEAITYNEKSGRWNTRIISVVFGCNGNLCNKPDLVPYLPSSFQIRINETWLNTSVLGTGAPVRDCHECPDAPQCGTEQFLDSGRCPVQACNTTCLVSDTFNNPADGLFCFQSFCAEPDSESLTIDPHRVEIEGVVYGQRPGVVEIWEIDVYCRADDCSRPDLFKELRENVNLQSGDLTILFNQTAEIPRIRCYDCYCEGEAGCSCDTVSSENAKSAYCTITRTYDGESVRLFFGHLELDSSYANVRELPYVLVDESIFYNSTTSQWTTVTTDIVYGCDWDYCNKPTLLPLLPSSFQMSLPESWLNANILGSGQPLRDCHECSNSSICAYNTTADGNLCPPQPCDSTCYVSNLYNNPSSNEQCYQSYCLPFNNTEFDYDENRIYLEAIVYASEPTNVEFWEIYVYCKADNCSRPEIFQEIRRQLDVKPGDLSTLFNETNVGEPGVLRCYDCYCENDPYCSCNDTKALPDNETYCTVIREYDGQDFWIILEHLDRNSSRTYIREFPFLLVDETILYNEASGQWNTQPTLIVYGCNTDFCNDPRLVPRLPIGFQMRVPDKWLNENVLGTGAPVRDCHECPDAPQCGTEEFLDPSRCPIRACNTTCLVSDTFNDPANGLLCYQSYCAPPDSPDFEIDPHRVEIEGILYGNRPNAQLEFWEIDIYCRADDCSRPDIFKELRSLVTVTWGDLSPFFNIIIIPPEKEQLACYECACYDDPLCPCNTVLLADADSTYCTIVRQNDGDGDFTIDLEHINRNSTRVYIRKFPYVLAEESILYRANTSQWYTRTNIIVYGCNWHLCNHPSLVTILPDSFKMILSDQWLNENILDSGDPYRDCHECPNTPQCDTIDFIDVGRCPVKQCNTTCVVSDLFDDPSTGLLCYQSYCASPEFDTEENRHRVELEGIIYGDRPNAVELWEIDLYCRASDCSRPSLFNDIRQNLTLQANNLTLLFDNSTRPSAKQIICYECTCFDDPNCECTTFTAYDADSSYCIIMRGNFGDDFVIDLQHVNRNSTQVYIREFPYLLVEESIIYNDTIRRWITRTNIVLYGCNWDYCNHPRYLPYIPSGFQMRLPDNWLNENVLGTGAPVRDCHECPDAPQCGTEDFLDPSRCPVQACNTTCLVSDTFNDPADGLLCYQSYCAPPNSPGFEIDPHRVELEGILYLYPMGRSVELWEIDIYCRADDCSRPSIFKELRDRLTVIIGDLSIFYNTTTSPAPPNTTTARPTTGTTTQPTTTQPGQTTTTAQPGQTTTTAQPGQTTTTTQPGQTTTTQRGQTTTTTGAATSIYMTKTNFILFFFFIFLMNLF